MPKNYISNLKNLDIEVKNTKKVVDVIVYEGILKQNPDNENKCFIIPKNTQNYEYYEFFKNNIVNIEKSATVINENSQVSQYLLVSIAKDSLAIKHKPFIVS